MYRCRTLSVEHLLLNANPKIFGSKIVENLENLFVENLEKYIVNFRNKKKTSLVSVFQWRLSHECN